jgi:hypothetical protein
MKTPKSTKKAQRSAQTLPIFATTVIGMDDYGAVPSPDAPVPSDRKACIDKICELFATAIKFTTAKFWHIGRILDTLEGRGETGVVEEVMQRTKYEEKTVRNPLALYRAFPDYGVVDELLKKSVEWTHFKKLASLADSDQRQKMIDSVLDGSLDPVDICDEVGKLKPRRPPIDLPGGPRAYIAKYTSLIERMGEQLQALEADYDAVLDVAADEERTADSEFEEFLRAIREAVTKMVGMQEQLKSICDKLESDVFAEEP